MSIEEKTEAQMDIDVDDEIERATQSLINKVISVRPRYIGIYAPGDFNVQSYRLVIPDGNTDKLGRGFHGAREVVTLESPVRNDVDIWIAALKDLVHKPVGLKAVRHILNPFHNKDEGLRLFWRKSIESGGDETMQGFDDDLESGKTEFIHWARRDQLISRDDGDSGYEQVERNVDIVYNGQMFTPPWTGLALPYVVISPTGTLSSVSPISPISMVYPGLGPINPNSALMMTNEPWDAEMEGLIPSE